MNFFIEAKLLIMSVASCSLFQKVVVDLVEIRLGFVGLSLLEWGVLGVEVAKMWVHFGVRWEVWLS